MIHRGRGDSHIPPTERDIADWIERGFCPPLALARASKLLLELWSGGDESHHSRLWLEWPQVLWEGLDGEVSLCCIPRRTADSPMRLPASEPLGKWPKLASKDISTDPSASLRFKHPLTPVVEAWRDRPKRLGVETRQDKRYLPDLREGKGGARQDVVGEWLGNARREAPQLPLFETGSPKAPRVPILDIADKAGAPVLAQGRGLPLPARTLLYALLLVPPRERPLGGADYAIKLRDMARRLWPGTTVYRKHVRLMVEALEELHRYRVVFPDGGWWTPAMLRGRVSAKETLDSEFYLNVSYPPGAGRGGPAVDLPKLWEMAAKSGPRCRAYIAAHTINYLPGKTRVPPRKGTPFRIWSTDPSAYPVLSPADRRRLAFGPQDVGDRTRRRIDAPWHALPGLVLREVGDGGVRLLPKEIVGNRTPPKKNR